MRVSRGVVIALMILAPVVLRLSENEWNLVPIGALALFCGARFRNRALALAIPIGSMVLGDVLLGIKHHNMGFYTFHALLPVIYSCFALSVLMGIGLRRHWDRLERDEPTRPVWPREETSAQQRWPFWLTSYVAPIAATTLAGSVLFFLVSNFGDWYVFYPHSAAGLADCYRKAIPFFRHTLTGDAIGSALLFGGDYLLRLNALAQTESERI
jgi:hypothetical protein